MLINLFSTVMPGVEASTMKPERALWGFADGSVLARTKYHCVREEGVSEGDGERGGREERTLATLWEGDG